MKVEIKRKQLVVEPENEQDRAFIEDTLGLKTKDSTLVLKRVDSVKLGFAKPDEYVLISDV